MKFTNNFEYRSHSISNEIDNRYYCRAKMLAVAVKRIEYQGGNKIYIEHQEDFEYFWNGIEEIYEKNYKILNPKKKGPLFIKIKDWGKYRTFREKKHKMLKTLKSKNKKFYVQIAYKTTYKHIFDKANELMLSKHLQNIQEKAQQ